jgi:hypothetical protein
MGVDNPTKLGGTIAVTDSTALASMDASGLPIGTQIWSEGVGAYFTLTISSASLVPDSVVAVLGVDGARWIINTHAGTVTTLGPISGTGDPSSPVTTLAIKSPCRAIATSNITLSGAQTIDGVSVIAGNRVLVTGQSTASQNGIYNAASGAWTRAADYAAGTSAGPGLIVGVTEGTAAADSLWTLTTDGAPVIGTDSIAFGRLTPFTSSGVYKLSQAVFPGGTAGAPGIADSVGSTGYELGAGFIFTDISGVRRWTTQFDRFVLSLNGTHGLKGSATGTAGLGLISSGDVIVGDDGAQATNAVVGFLELNSGAGAPTGTATPSTGKVPIYIDSTNKKIYLWIGGSWVSTPALT